MPDVDVDEAKVVVAEGNLAFGRAFGERLCPSVQTFGLEDTPDAVPVEVRQEVGDDEGEIIEREVGGAPQAADDGTLFFGGLPRELVRTGRAIEAIRGASLAPLAHGLGADAVALGDDAAGLHGASDLGAGGGGGAGVRVDVQHGSPLSWCSAQTVKPIGVVDNSQSDRVPTMFCDLTGR